MEPPITKNSSRSATYWRITLVFGLGLLIAVSSFGAGILAERDLINDGATAGATGSSEFELLDEVKDYVDTEYYAAPDGDDAASEFEQQLEYGAIQGMMGTLDDYSTFLVPAEQTAIQEQLSGEYQGIGVWVDFPDGKLTVVATMPGSPAEAAGLKGGDVIEAADGHSLLNTTAEDALNFVRGPEGSTVRLTIRRAGTASTFDVDVERHRIPVQSVTYRVLPEYDVAVIRVTVFGDNTTSELDSALQKARADEVAGIVLDLRNNGGGWVNSAQEMIGRFVPESRGPALFEELDPDGSDRTELPIVGGGTETFGTPLVVLVNSGTASAAEIVAGALHDYGRATIVGERTFGKGSVQRVHGFSDGSSVRITFAQWLTPNEQRIQGAGIEPDVAVAATETNGTNDPQLVRAVQLLTGVVETPPIDAPPSPVVVASPNATPMASPAP
jgi:carboxyl-terminal processing protease